MALIIEDGTGKADANSYDSLANIQAYLTARGRTASVISAIDDAVIIQATQNIDNLYRDKFSGYQSSEEQSLEYPRIGSMRGIWYVDSDEIPQKLKNALAEMCFYQADGVEINPATQTGIKRVREKVDVLETEIEYTGSTAISTEKVVLTNVINELKPLFNNINGVIRRG